MHDTLFNLPKVIYDNVVGLMGWFPTVGRLPLWLANCQQIYFHERSIEHQRDVSCACEKSIHISYDSDTEKTVTANILWQQGGSINFSPFVRGVPFLCTGFKILSTCSMTAFCGWVGQRKMLEWLRKKGKICPLKIDLLSSKQAFYWKKNACSISLVGCSFMLALKLEC